MLTRLFALRLAAHGIGVFEVRPGIIRTAMTAPVAERYEREIARGITPIARWGEPADVGRAVATIATGGLPFSVGQVIYVDGGLSLTALRQRDACQRIRGSGTVAFGNVERPGLRRADALKGELTVQLRLVGRRAAEAAGVLTGWNGGGSRWPSASSW